MSCDRRVDGSVRLLGELGEGFGVGVESRLPPRCAPGEIRTPNLLIRSQMLYPLSYGRLRYRSNAGGSLARASLVKVRGCTAFPSEA
jgi:hypothetical protein